MLVDRQRARRKIKPGRADRYPSRRKRFGEGAIRSPEESAYDGYYKVIANPLLWFLQHSMWDIFRSPTIDRTTWQNWQNGYMVVNRLFAGGGDETDTGKEPAFLGDATGLSLVLSSVLHPPGIPPEEKYTLMHFIHIPWPEQRIGLLARTCGRAS
jgi:trehalose 6-phosphate synthase